MNPPARRVVAALALAALLHGCATPEPPPAPPQPPPAPEFGPPPKIGLALGGGAARGFAHVGVIKVLESHGIVPDYVAGTSAGSLVGALYAAGHTGYELQRRALQVDESTVGDIAFPDRGFLKGEQLQNYVNRAVGGRTIEKLQKPFGAVATDLASGASVVFRRGDTGMAVRASSTVPGLFQPVKIGEREYVDGGLVSPVPVRAVREMGAELVIAVDISGDPRAGRTADILDVLLQTFTIMGKSLATREAAEADVVIRPQLARIGGADFESRHLAILEGEAAAQKALAEIQARIRAFREKGAIHR